MDTSETEPRNAKLSTVENIISIYRWYWEYYSSERSSKAPESGEITYSRGFQPGNPVKKNLTPAEQALGPQIWYIRT